jgi:hypothetical protein
MIATRAPFASPFACSHAPKSRERLSSSSKVIVVFAASERGRYLTGANISTDGAASHVVI